VQQLRFGRVGLELRGMRRWLFFVATLLLSPALATWPAIAQTCTADSQCRDAGVSRTYCSGNTVVTARSVCIGTCRTVEERRETCAGVCLAGRCTGAPIETRPLPTPRVPRCLPSCTCRNKILIVTTGDWSPDRGCEQLIRRCARGCSCDPTPICR